MADSENGCPPERDVKDFSFKQMRKIRMFESPQSIPTVRSSLLDTSSKYGLTFVGCPRGIKILKTETIEAIHEKDEGSMQNVVPHCPSSFVDLGNPVLSVCLSGNDLTLSVCYTKENATVMAFFDVPTLGSTELSSAKFGEINLTKNAEAVVNVEWNPGFLGLFAICLSSGSVMVMELTETEIKTVASLPADHKASATCWSPKGKELVVGHSDGKITQYSQTLEAKREIECPEIFNDDPHFVTDVLWISTYLFAVVYSSFEDGDCPKFLLISTPNNGPVVITNFDDIYFPMSDDREPAFYLRNISKWSIVVSAFSNGLEAAVVGKYGGETAATWEKWSFEEDARPSMPLTSNNDDSFPMGLAINFNSTRPFVKGEEKLPPAPIMMILSTDGVLCPFYVLNQTPNTNHDIVKPPEPLPLGGLRKPVGYVVQSGGTTLQAMTGNSAPANKSSLQSGSLATSRNIPVGAFSKENLKPDKPSSSSPALLGFPGHASFGGLSLGGPKQASASATNAPNAFSKQSVQSSGLSGSASSSDFSLPSQQAGLTAFKPPLQPQLPAVQLEKPQAVSSALVKPTPTCQTQLNVAGHHDSPFNTAMVSTQSKQEFSLGRGQPMISASPSPKPGLDLVDKSGSKSNQLSVSKPSATAVRADSSAATSFDSQQGFSLGRGQPMISASPSPKPGLDLVDKSGSKSNQLPVSKPSATAVKADSSAATSFDSQVKASTTATKIKAEGMRKEQRVPVSKSNVIEASVSQNIQEAIDHFSSEMATLCDCVKKMQMNCGLTDDKNDLHQLKKTTDQIGRSIAGLKDITKDQHKDIDEEERKLLEAFEIFEDARIRQERKSDPRYVQLLKARALDPVNANKMRDIRKLHLYLDESLRDVNMTLDEQWNKENERKRSIPRPALDEIYNALKMNQKIALDQEARLEKIAGDMQKRKLLSNSWRRNSTSTDSARLPLVKSVSAMYEEELKLTTERTSPVANPISPKKSARLRSMLQKRRSTPVRRSIIVPSTSAKTPSVKLNTSQMPLLSSTPAVTASARSEETISGFVLRSQLTEQEEATLHRDNRGILDGIDQEVAHASEERGPGRGTSVRASFVSLVDASSPDDHPGDTTKEASNLEDGLEKPPVVVATPEVTESATEVPGSACSTAACGGFSLGGIFFKPEVTNDECQSKKPIVVTSNAEVTSGALAKPSLQVTASGAFIAVGKPTESQTALNATDTELSKPSRGSFHLAASEQTSSCGAASTKSEVTPGVKAISVEVPPNVAAGMAAMNRASAVQNGLQFPSNNSNLDPSASIEPVALVAYKPQTQKPAPKIGGNAENAAAKAIANAALMAATAEAKKPSAKPHSSTEFVFKSTQSGTSGPPVVTFKPQAPPTPSDSRTIVAPNVTVNPKPVINPAFSPAVPTSSTVSSTSGLRLSSSGPSPVAPFGPLPRSSASTGFAPQPGLFNLGSHAKTTSSAPNLLSSHSKGGDAMSSGQTTVSSSTTASITPSQRISRNIFASSEVRLPPTSKIDDLKDDSKESSLLSSSQEKASIISSSRVTAPVTTAPLSLALSSLSSGSFMQNQVSSSDSGNAMNSGVKASFLGSDAPSFSTSLSEDKSKESSLSLSSQMKGSITSSSGVVAPVTTAPLSFSLSSLSSGSFIQNQVSSSNSGNAINSGVNASFLGSDARSLSTSSSEDKSKEASIPWVISKSSVTSSSGLIPSQLSFTVPTLSGGSFFKNLATTNNTGSSTGAISGTVGSSTSMMSSLQRSSETSGTGIISSNTAFAPTSIAVLSSGTSTETKDASGATAFTSPSVGTISGAGGFFTQGLLEGSKSVFVPAESAAPTLTQASRIFGSVSTTVPSTTGVLLESPSTSSKVPVSTPPTTSVKSSFLALSAGSPSSAFSVSSTASAFVPSSVNAFTKESASIESPPVTVMSSSQSTTTTLATAGSSSASVPSGLFASPISTFGAVPTVDGSLGFGSLAKAATSSSSGGLFGASSSTAFAPTSLFGAFTTPAGSQGNTFGSAPVFGSSSASPAASLSFGAKPSFGQSSFIPTTSSGFSQTASTPSENALALGLAGFGLGGSGTSQANNENSFIVAQGFAVSETKQSSLFGGKSGDNVFKISHSTGPFSQAAFGSSSSGGFSGGSFSSQNRSVLSSGFGFGASPIPAGNSGFGSSQPFGSPSASASAFGGAPSFGSTPAFGGVPTFGGSPQGEMSAAPSTGVFGSGGSGMFGQSSGSPSFGALASQTGVPSFGALAGQSSSQVGFGGLQPQQEQSTPSFGSFGGSSQSPGGSSFSQWR